MPLSASICTGWGEEDPGDSAQPVRSPDQGPAFKWQNQVLNPQLLLMSFMSFPDSTSGKQTPPACPAALGSHLLYPAPPAPHLLDTGWGLCDSLSVQHVPVRTPLPGGPVGSDLCCGDGRDGVNLTSSPTSSSLGL